MQKKKFDGFYKFFTDNSYPCPGTLTHTIEPDEWWQSVERSNGNIDKEKEPLRCESIKRSGEIIAKHKSEGLYFQEIICLPPGMGESYFSQTRAYGKRFVTPIFIFGNKNKMMVEYINFRLENQGRNQADYYYGDDKEDNNVLKKLKERDDSFPHKYQHYEVALNHFGRREHVKEKQLRWCHAGVCTNSNKKKFECFIF